MSIQEQVNAAFRQARLDRDDATKTVIGMLKSKVMTELKSGKGREENDDLWLEVLGAYAKQLKKSMAEFEGLGERGQEALREAQFELDFCQRYLPTVLDEAATKELVAATIAELGLSAPKDMGRLMGAIMKSHKGKVDGGLVRRFAQELLKP